MSDYIPGKDVDFNLWQENLVSYTEPQLETWGILASDFTTLKTAQGVWVEGYTPAEIKSARNGGDVQGKDDARELYMKALRLFVKQWLAFNTRVSDKDRDLMGLTVKTNAYTPATKPTTVPVGKIDFSNRLQHKIHFVDEATPTRKAKPAGARGCEVWVKFDGAAPTGPSELSYVSTASRTPCVATIESKYAGKIAYYMPRWVNTRGEFGPWSSTVSATVAG